MASNIEPQKPKKKLLWILWVFLALSLVCCLTSVGFIYFNKTPIISIALPTATSTPEPVLATSIYDSVSIGSYKVIYMGGFLTKYDAKFPGFDTKPDLEEGQYLITTVYEITNNGTTLDENSFKDIMLVSPNDNIYKSSNSYFLTSLMTDIKYGLNKDLNLSNLSALGEKDILPGQTKKFITGFTISQKEFEESANDWKLIIPINDGVKYSIPKGSLIEFTNFLAFSAGLRASEEKIKR